MNQPKISVIIPCHNSENWLPETLASIQQQESVIEVILVDDASTDNSIKVANFYSSILPLKVISSSRKGVSAARNTGLYYSSGEWVQFLDADDVLMPGKLARHLHIGVSRQADFVYGSWQTYQENAKGEFVPQQVTVPDYSEDLVASLLKDDNFCQIGAALFRRQILINIGGFRVDMNCVEDVNLYLRLALSDANFVKDESVNVSLLYRKHKSSCSLGTRDRPAFYAGCLINIILVEETWKKKVEQISSHQQKLLLEAYGTIARFYFENDRSKFYEILTRIHNLNPNYLPSGPTALRQLSKCLGYENAEAIALSYRRLKSLLLN